MTVIDAANSSVSAMDLSLFDCLRNGYITTSDLDKLVKFDSMLNFMPSIVLELFSGEISRSSVMEKLDWVFTKVIPSCLSLSRLQEELSIAFTIDDTHSYTMSINNDGVTVKFGIEKSCTTFVEMTALGLDSYLRHRIFDAASKSVPGLDLDTSATLGIQEFTASIYC